MVAELKKTEDGVLQDEYRTVQFRIKRQKEQSLLKDVVLSTAHIRNIIILLYQHLDKKKDPNANGMLNARVVRALAAGTPGGKLREQVEALRESLKDQQLFADFLTVAATLKEKNIHALVTKLKASYQSFRTKHHNGDKKARPPKPKALRKFSHFAAPIDQCAFSLKRKNQIGINLSGRMEYFALNHEAIVAACGSISAVQALEVCLSHGEVYLSIIYRRTVPQAPVPTLIKHMGIDLGLVNLASIFVADSETLSLIIKGDRLIQYNARFNRILSRLQQRRDVLRTAIKKQKEEAAKKGDEGKPQQRSPEELEEAQINKRIRRLFSERKKYYDDIFHKLAVRILEYCLAHGVSHLHLSRNLGFIKMQEAPVDKDGKKKKRMSKKTNQKFCQIPMASLIDRLKEKGAEYGIRVEDTVDEAYSSKVSCIHGDVCAVQAMSRHGGKGKPSTTEPDATAPQPAEKVGDSKNELSNAFGGRRERRDRYYDFVSGKKYLADLNGAANHVKLAVGCRLDWLQSHMWKLANPVVFQCDSMFLDRRIVRRGDKEERPDSERQSWIYATWSPQTQ